MSEEELNDFGFTAMTFDDISSILKESQKDEIKTTEEKYQEKINSLSDIIIPLLNNLCKNPDKEYIYWPNRVEKIEKQIQKVNNILGKK